MDGFQFTATRSYRIFLTIFCVTALTACGGGGGGNITEPEPPLAAPSKPTLTVAIGGTKILGFAWTGGDGADNFQLMENPTGASGFSQLGTNFAASVSNTDIEIPVHLLNWANATY